MGSLAGWFAQAKPASIPPKEEEETRHREICASLVLEQRYLCDSIMFFFFDKTVWYSAASQGEEAAAEEEEDMAAVKGAFYLSLEIAPTVKYISRTKGIRVCFQLSISRDPFRCDAAEIC
ncbi:hypothetical protein RUM43_007210 [Polyplax serrata]|uniref:Uncharacterized protein n=1 Tax=Polyplax serrata TaxID=468196 RepID=A0AAN8S5C0_POLSC